MLYKKEAVRILLTALLVINSYAGAFTPSSLSIYVQIRVKSLFYTEVTYCEQEF